MENELDPIEPAENLKQIPVGGLSVGDSDLSPVVKPLEAAPKETDE